MNTLITCVIYNNKKIINAIVPLSVVLGLKLYFSKKLKVNYSEKMVFEFRYMGPDESTNYIKLLRTQHSKNNNKGWDKYVSDEQFIMSSDNTAGIITRSFIKKNIYVLHDAF